MCRVALSHVSQECQWSLDLILVAPEAVGTAFSNECVGFWVPTRRVTLGPETVNVLELGRGLMLGGVGEALSMLRPS